MVGDNGLYNGEAKPIPAPVGPAAGEEFLCDQRNLIGRNTNAMIADPKHESPSVMSGFNAQELVGPGVPDRVVNHVVERKAHRLAVHANGWQRRWNIDAHFNLVL